MNPLLLPKVIPLCVGLLLLVLALIWASRIKASVSDPAAIRSEGTVVGFSLGNSRERLSYFPVVKFDTDDGYEVQFVSSVGSNPPQYAEGAKVTVIYLPETPEKARIDSLTGLWTGPLIVGLIGAIFTLISGLLLALPLILPANPG